MSNPNPVNLNNLDGRYTKPSDVTAAIQSQTGSSVWTPADNGFLTSTIIPPWAMANTGQPTNALIYFHRMPVRTPLTITSLCIAGTAAASSAASTGTYMAIYNPSGTRIAVSNDAASIFATAPVSSVFTVPLTSPVAVSQPWVYAALLFNMTNLPTLMYTGNAANARAPASINLTTSGYMFASTPSGPTYTSMPSTMTYSNNVFFYSNPYFIGAI